MYTAKDIMTKEVRTVSLHTSIADAVKILLEHKMNGLPVVDNAGKLVGILCQSDLVAMQKRVTLPSIFSLFDGFIPLGNFDKWEGEMKKVTALTVEDAMSKNPTVVYPDTSVEEIATLMVDNKYYTLPVLDVDKKLIGVIGKEDILKTLIKG